MPSVVTSDNVRIHFDVHGTGSLPILFMHGWAGSRRYFLEMIQALGGVDARFITLDLRGHAKSDRPGHGFTLDQFAADVLSVADAAGARRFVLVGFSMSGRFAQYVAVSAPDR